ncbi:MAG: PQQ-dependent sugar dehydrogenase [Phycisphaerales bacterium]
MKSSGVAAILAMGIWASVAVGQNRPAVDPQVRVREGFSLSVAAEVRGARFMAFDPNGTLFVSQPQSRQISACRDRNGDGYYETTAVFVKDHPTVQGLFWFEGWLWFTESGAIFKARDTTGDDIADEQQTIIPEGQLPQGGHWWRPILIHKGRLYTGIGDSGNITDESATDREKIWTYDPQGKDKQLFISGIRNTEKLVVRPGTDEIWGMDHGSDWFGRELEQKDSGHGQPITDLNPPDEMNHYIQGGFYGHPFLVGSRIPRYEYMNRPDIVALAAKTVPPEWSTGAHWAPNAMVFYTGRQFPADHVGNAFVAYHGSWNRDRKAGYCVTRVLFDAGRPYGELVYANFLTDDGKVLARPVDVVVAPDGTLLISDDEGGRIYRMSCERPSGPVAGQ